MIGTMTNGKHLVFHAHEGSDMTQRANTTHTMTFRLPVLLILMGMLVGCGLPGTGSEQGQTELATSKHNLSSDTDVSDVCGFFAKDGKRRRIVGVCHRMRMPLHSCRKRKARKPQKPKYVLLRLRPASCRRFLKRFKHDFVSIDGKTCAQNGCYPKDTPTDGRFPCCEGLENKDGICTELPPDPCPPTNCTQTGVCFLDGFTSGTIEGQAPTSTAQCIDKTFTSQTPQGTVCYRVPQSETAPGSCNPRNTGNIVDFLTPSFSPANWSSLLNFFGGAATDSHVTTRLHTTAGATYQVSFDVRQVESGVPVASRHTLQATATDAQGTVLGSSQAIPTPTSATPTSVSFTFVAQSGLTVLSIKGTLCTAAGCNTNQDIGLDQLKVERLQ
jgi:hypothetical protein